MADYLCIHVSYGDSISSFEFRSRGCGGVVAAQCSSKYQVTCWMVLRIDLLFQEGIVSVSVSVSSPQFLAAVFFLLDGARLV